MWAPQMQDCFPGRTKPAVGTESRPMQSAPSPHCCDSAVRSPLFSPLYLL